MGNQQGNADDFDIGWLAGFIDGEGSFNIHRRDYAKGQRGYRPWFTVANTHAETLSRVTSILDALGIAYHVAWSHDRVRGRRALWRVTITGLKRMERWLTVIGPRLFTKRCQAELLLRFVQLRLANSGWRIGLSDEEKALVPQLLTMNRPESLTDYTPGRDLQARMV